MNSRTQKPLIYLLILAASIHFLLLQTPTAGFCQSRQDLWMEQMDAGETKVRVNAIRGLSGRIIRQFVSADERAAILTKFNKTANDTDPVVRLAVHVELLKIAASEGNSQMASHAMLALSDPNINVRRGMIKFFRTFYSGRYESGREFEQLLTDLLDDKDLETRFHSASTLFSWGVSSDRITDVLLDAIDLGNYRDSIVYALVQDRQHRSATIAKLLGRLKNSNHNAGVHINLISLLMPESRSAFKELIPFYESKDVGVRAAVVDAIGRMNMEQELSTKILLRAVEDPSSIIRQLVLPSLVRLEPEFDVLKECVLRLLKDKDDQVALAAADAFSFFEGRFDEILPEIAAVFQGDEPKQIRAGLSGCMTAGPMAVASGPWVIPLLKHDDPVIREYACWTLYEISAAESEVISGLHGLSASETVPRVKSTAIDILSLFAPTDEISRGIFINGLTDSNPVTRMSCVRGLQNYPSGEIVEQILKVESAPATRTSVQMSKLDNQVISTLISYGDVAANIVIKYLDHPDPAVRSRAIAIAAHSKSLDDDAESRIVAGLKSQHTVVQLAAARAVSMFEEIDASILEQMFAITSPNSRTQTVAILNIFADMKSKASSITPQIANLMNGGYNNRFANDAKNCLVSLGEHAAPAVPVLLDGELTPHKITCLKAIGPAAKAATEKLAALVGELTDEINNERSTKALSMHRRRRISAVLALGMITRNAARPSKIFRQELHTETKRVALAAIAEFAAIDKSLVDDVIALLPEKTAIETLAAIGPPATAAVEPLREITIGSDRSIGYLARKALWQIQDDPELAVDAANKILNDNRFEAVEIRVEDRQKLWETLRYLALNQGSSDEAKQMLKRVERGRFPNLRAFVKQLPAG